jgi:uncharacterized protein YjdB
MVDGRGGIGSSAYLSEPAGDAEWSLYVPAQENPAQVVFTVQGNDYSNTLFYFRDVPSDRTSAVYNQDISGITIDLGNISPNSLRVFNNPPGQYTVKLTTDHINQSTYQTVSTVATVNGSGRDVSLNISLDKSYGVLITAGGVTRYTNYVYFAGSGSVDWNTMTEISGSVDTPVTGISLNKSSASIAVDSSETLTATVSPNNASNKNVTWSSGNNAVATVSSNGTVTGVSAGATAIRVSSAENSSIYAECTVTVTGSGTPPGGDALPGAKGKLTLTGFDEFNGSYVYSGLMTASGKVLIGTNSVDYNGGNPVVSMVRISGGRAEVPLYTANSGGASLADIYVPYEGSEGFQAVAVMIVNDSDGKFTASDATSFGTNWVAMLSSNAMNTSFTPSTINGSITIDRSEAASELTMDNMYTIKYMLVVK